MLLCSLICNAVYFNPLGFKRSRSVSDISQILLVWNILKCFPSETTRPGCIAYHYFGTVTLYLQKFIVETNVQKVYIIFKSQGSGPNGTLVYRCASLSNMTPTERAVFFLPNDTKNMVNHKRWLSYSLIKCVSHRYWPFIVFYMYT